MPSTYSPNKSYELQATGENPNTWGILLDAVLSIIDLNFGGRLALNCAGASDVTLTSTQARNLVINCTGVLTGSINVIVPNTGSFYFVYNNTTGAFTLSVKPAGGTAITVPQGGRALLFANPTSGAMEDYTNATSATPTFTSFDAGASAGPVLTLDRASASPAASDLIGTLTLQGRDSAGNAQEYGKVQGKITDATSGSEDGELDFYATVAGSTSLQGWFTANNLWIYSDDAGATAGPAFNSYRASASPAASDLIGVTNYYGRDSGANATLYARTWARIDDPTDASEDGFWALDMFVAGTSRQVFYFSTGQPVFAYYDDGAGVGPVAYLDRSSASPAANDVIGRLNYRGRDDGAAAQDYAWIGTTILDPTAGSEDARLIFSVTTAGTGLSSMFLEGTSLILQSTDAGASAAPILQMYRLGGTPAASDIIGQITFFGEDAGLDASTNYASINTMIDDTTGGSEDGHLRFVTMVAGTAALRWNLGNGIYGTGLSDMGANTVNAAGFYISGTSILARANTWTAAQTTAITSAAAAAVTFQCSEDSATGGPYQDIDRISASPAASDQIGAVRIRGRDSGGTTTPFAGYSVVILDPTDTSEDGQLNFNTVVAGTFAQRGYFAQGFVVGSATGGDKGVGTANFAADIYKNNTAYTNPDYVFEHEFTGRIEKFAHSDGAAGYRGRLPLDELEAHIRRTLRLPGITDEPMGVFERADKVLEKIEEIVLYLIDINRRLTALELGASR